MFYGEKGNDKVVKKAKRLLAVVLAVCVLMVSAAMPASAATSHSFAFTFSDEIQGNLRSTSLYMRGSGTASVTTDVEATMTLYYLSPARVSSTQATYGVYRKYAGTSSFYRFCGNNGMYRQTT